MLPWIILVIFIIFYWKCVYYKYHTSDITPISLFLLGLFLGVTGILFYFTGQISTTVLFENILPTYSILIAFMIVSYILIYIGYKDNKKHINKHIDVFLTFMKTHELWKIVPILLAASFPLVIFIVIGSYIVMGPDHIYIWAIVFVGWIGSNARLVNYIEKIKSK